MKARFVFENIRFERGMDPKRAMGVGIKEYIKSLLWGFSGQFIDQILDDETLEIISYKGFTILLRKETNIPGVTVHNPWNSDDIWIAMANTRPEIPIRDASPRSRAPGKTKALNNVKRQINYHLKKAGVSESVNFERGKDPKEAMGVGIESRLRDEEYVDDMIIEFDREHGSAAQVYLPGDLRIKLVRMILLQEYEFKIVEEIDDEPAEDSEGYYEVDEYLGPEQIDYDIADAESEGWELLHTEHNYDVAQAVMYREL